MSAGPVSRIGDILVETYRIERLVGEGGMGSVYEARHLRLPKRFAVKFLNLNLLDSTEALVRFRREAEIIATLEHPNLVSVFDYNVTDDGVPYVVLEFLDGEHLGKRIARGRIPLAEAMEIIAPVVQALAVAHAREIVHRDLKPENIVLCKGGLVKVVDFGIAKIRGGAELTANNTVLGTVPYMAPEQLFGSQVDARADQFALGAIVYEMLSGEMAFGGPQSVPEIAARVAHHQPAPIAGVSPAVCGAVFQAIAKDAEARFPSVHSFFLALVEAASRPDEGPVPDVSAATDDELPPLEGEATSISRLPLAAASTLDAHHPPLGDDGDDEDALAPPPQARPERVAPAVPRVAASTVPSMPVEATGLTRLPTVRDMPTVVTEQISSGDDELPSGNTATGVQAPQLRGSATRMWLVVGIVVVVLAGIGIRLLLVNP